MFYPLHSSSFRCVFLSSPFQSLKSQFTAFVLTWRLHELLWRIGRHTVTLRYVERSLVVVSVCVRIGKYLLPADNEYSAAVCQTS